MNELDYMDGRDCTGFEFTMNLGGVNYIWTLYMNLLNCPIGHPGSLRTPAKWTLKDDLELTKGTGHDVINAFRYFVQIYDSNLPFVVKILRLVRYTWQYLAPYYTAMNLMTQNGASKLNKLRD